MNFTVTTDTTVETARILGGTEIVQVLKRSNKTTLVAPYSERSFSGGKETQRLNNRFLSPDPIVALTVKNAPEVSTIISRKNPEWGVQRFQFDPSHQNHARGNNLSVCLFENEFKFWRVVSLKLKENKYRALYAD